MSDALRWERDGDVHVLTLARADAANALDRDLVARLTETARALAADDTARAVIVTGEGPKAFCAGADLKERAGMSEDEVRTAVRAIQDAITAVAALPMPTIAAVNGAALGGGTELALACDVRLMSSSATMGLTETTLAIIPGGGGTQRLPRLVGPGRAKELIFTGRRVGADEALRIGLVEAVCDPETLAQRARQLAVDIAANGPIAVRAAKEAIARGLDLSLDDGLALEREMYSRTIDTTDRLEGLAAFREKRAPQYRGE